MRKLNLQLFSGSSVTCLKDGHMTTFSASQNSSVAKDAEVALTVTPASGYELDEIEVIAGGVTLAYDATDGWSFVMGESDVTLYAKTKANNLYRVTEECSICINGAKTVFHKNVEVVLAKNGSIVDVNATPTAVTMNDAVQQLIDQGILVKV